MDIAHAVNSSQHRKLPVLAWFAATLLLFGKSRQSGFVHIVPHAGAGLGTVTDSSARLPPGTL